MWAGAIKHIWITDSAPAGRLLILRIYFDGRKAPAVEVPLADFFASANYNEYRQINILPICVNPLAYMENYTVLDGIKGNGQYVGTYLYWGVKSNGWWGEGEFKFYIDGDTDYPTICGTGTEDYFCGAYNFDVDGKYREFSSPYTGLSKVDHTNEAYAAQHRFNLYRFHITDPIYFKENLKVTVQALGWRSEGRYLPLQDDISSVAYWYSDHLEDVYPTLPNADGLEII